MAPPAPPVVVFTPSAGTAAKPLNSARGEPELLVLLLDELDELLVELDELELEDELLEDEELEELELLDELDEEFEELLLDDELDELPEDLGIEHSLTPPGTLVPAPKVTSPQTKLPLSTLKVKRSARP
jgi:hypothetical protein